MKDLYQALALIALFLMVMANVMTFATTPEEATVWRLDAAPEGWRIEVVEDEFRFSTDDEEKLKLDVLGFFKQAGSPTHSKVGHYFVYLSIIFVFSVVGYVRERWLKRNYERTKNDGAD